MLSLLALPPTLLNTLLSEACAVRGRATPRASRTGGAQGPARVRCYSSLARVSCFPEAWFLATEGQVFCVPGPPLQTLSGLKKKNAFLYKRQTAQGSPHSGPGTPSPHGILGYNSPNPSPQTSPVPSSVPSVGKRVIGLFPERQREDPSKLTPGGELRTQALSSRPLQPGAEP